MKRLDIKNFVQRMNEIESDFFGVRYCSDADDKYILGLDTNDVISFKQLKPKHYKMAIDKICREDGRYHIWLWDMESNISYPMSIMPDNISSLSEFTSFLNNTLKVADRGEFSGSNGCMIK
jgi:hypothetical protein